MSEIELSEFKKYANMFYSYRNVSVWSAPEVLKQPKKLLEPTKAMDVYSFGLIMWELYHESVPFENDLKACTEYVVNGDERPKIQTVNEEDEDAESESTLKPACSVPISDLIRLCWKSDPAARPTFTDILEVLFQERTYFARADEIEVQYEDEDADEMETLIAQQKNKSLQSPKQL